MKITMNLFIFITHIWNANIQNRFEWIKKSLESLDIELYLMYSNIAENNIQDIYKTKSFKYNNSDINNHRKYTKANYNYIDPFDAFKPIYYNNVDFFNSYQHIYFCEYDIWYNGNFEEYISKLNQDNCDLIAAYIEKVYKGYPWQHINFWYDEKEKQNISLDFNVYLKSCISFFRISSKYLNKVLSDKYKEFTDIALYELYVPTIIYNEGGTIKSLNKENNEFDWRDDLNPETFFFSKHFLSIKEMDSIGQKYNSPKLFTCWKTDNSKLVSICILCHNNEKTIEKSLLSAINQTYWNIEIVIVDNCSTDNTVQIIKEYINKYPTLIRYYYNEHNSITIGRNLLYNLANGDFIQNLDGDDELDVECIKTKMDIYKDQNHIIIGNNVIGASSYMDIYGLNVNKGDRTKIPTYTLCFGTILFSKDILDTFKDKTYFVYEEYFGLEHGGEDQLFLIHCWLNPNIKFEFINKPLYTYYPQYSWVSDKTKIRRNPYIKLIINNMNPSEYYDIMYNNKFESFIKNYPNLDVT